jgi:hypothetical protein
VSIGVWSTEAAVSSPIKSVKDLNSALTYAPPWVRERAGVEPEPKRLPQAPTIATPRRRRFGDDGPAFSGDLAMAKLQRQLALSPDKVPEPPVDDARSLWPMALRLLGVGGVAAVVAWLMISVPGVRLFRGDAARTDIPKPAVASDSSFEPLRSAPTVGSLLQNAPAQSSFDRDSAPQTRPDAAQPIVAPPQQPVTTIPQIATALPQAASLPHVAAFPQAAPAAQPAPPPPQPGPPPAATPPSAAFPQAATPPQASAFPQVASLPQQSAAPHVAAVPQPAAAPQAPAQPPAPPAAALPKVASLPSATAPQTVLAPPAESNRPAENKTLSLSGDEIAMLLKRGKDFFVNGDLSSARLLLRRAAEAGSAEAALALGATFDPLVIRRLGAIGAEPDVASARRWYQKAVDLGSNAAAQQLSNLAIYP